jgi:hypothetical protein
MGEKWMSKIPVGKTISDAYGYAFGQFLPNLGIIWLPMILLFGLMALVFPLYFGAISHMMSTLQPAQPGTVPDISGVMAIYRYMLVFYIVEVLILAQITLGMTRRALGMDQGPVYFFLSIGRTYWQLVGAYLIMIVIFIAVLFVVEIATIIVGLVVGLTVGLGAAGSHAGPSAVAGMGALAVLGVIGLGLTCLFVIAYIMSRLTFLLTPAIVAEDRFALMRSWELTKGSFWRMVVIALAVFGPIFIVIMIFDLVMFGMAGQSIMHILPTGPDPQANSQAMAAFSAAIMGSMIHYWYVFAAASLLLSAVTYGLSAGAAASAYRSQTEGTIPATFS